ncbi:GSCOCG00012854001-RA-CDS [Cotesia congregata]|nr:GSCOCG00012854001-RA-CDS [Cotesia congregata]
MACCPTISFIKILQFVIVCCIFGLDIRGKAFSDSSKNETLLNELVDKIPENNITIPLLNIKLNAESIPTEYISTGTVVAYFIIIFVSFVSGLFGSPLTKLPVSICVHC